MREGHDGGQRVLDQTMSSESKDTDSHSTLCCAGKNAVTPCCWPPRPCPIALALRFVTVSREESRVSCPGGRENRNGPGFPSFCSSASLVLGGRTADLTHLLSPEKSTHKKNRIFIPSRRFSRTEYEKDEYEETRSEIICILSLYVFP